MFKGEVHENFNASKALFAYFLRDFLSSLDFYRNRLLLSCEAEVGR